MAKDSTTLLQGWIDRLNAGDPAARDALIQHAYERLRKLTRKLLRQDFMRVRSQEETDDVLQNVSLRLRRRLEKARVPTVAEFFRLAGRETRRELLQLVAHHFGPHGDAARQVPLDAPAGSAVRPAPVGDRIETTYVPDRLALWGEFHRQVEALPRDERDVFDLIWYEGLTQAAAARVLGITEPALRSRWGKARLRLRTFLQDDLFS